MANSGMDMEDIVEEGPVMVLAEGFHVVKIDPGLQKLIVAIANCLEVFGQSHVEVGKVVTEENVTLLVRLDVPNLDGLEEPMHMLRGVFPRHGADCTTKTAHRKPQREH